MPSRRQRHLTLKKGIGALAIWDARSVGIANNATLTTWPDNSGNGYSLSNSTNKPTYIYAAQGGNPVVRFNPAATATQAMTSTLSLNNASATHFCVYKRTSSNSNVYSNFTVVMGGNQAAGSGGRWSFAYDDTPYFIVQQRNDTAAEVVNASRNNSANIHAMDGTTSSLNYWINGVSQGSAGGVSGYTCLYRVGGCATTMFGFIGDLMCIIAFNSVLNESIRKRINNSLSLTWKIACS